MQIRTKVDEVQILPRFSKSILKIGWFELHPTTRCADSITEQPIHANYVLQSLSLLMFKLMFYDAAQTERERKSNTSF